MFRHYEVEQVVLLGWSNNQWISVGLVALGTVILLLIRRGPVREGGTP